MSGLKAEADPAEVGLDAERLRRIDRHFARYVDDGRLPVIGEPRLSGAAPGRWAAAIAPPWYGIRAR